MSCAQVLKVLMVRMKFFVDFRDDAINLIYPRLNFCMPLTWIWQALQNFLFHKGMIRVVTFCMLMSAHMTTVCIGIDESSCYIFGNVSIRPYSIYSPL